jgi:hypothetical protein
MMVPYARALPARRNRKIKRRICSGIEVWKRPPGYEAAIDPVEPPQLPILREAYDVGQNAPAVLVGGAVGTGDKELGAAKLDASKRMMKGSPLPA